MLRRVALVCSLAIAAAAITGPAALAQKRGGVLQAALDAEPASMDPYFYTNFEDRNFYNLFYDNLVQQKADGTIVPMLATSWKTSEDGLSLTLTLRQDVTFHDGTPFNAEAVKFNLDRLADPANSATARAYIADVEGVDVIDPFTVRIRLKQRSDVVLSALAIEPGQMASPAAVKKFGRDYGRNPVGTGPFVFKSWGGGKVVAERWPDYWRKAPDGKPLPYLDGVDMRIVSNASVRILELKAGSLQLINRLQVKDFPQVRDQPNLALLERGQSALQYLAFNITKPPMNNIDLRKAVSLAINKQAVEKLIANGEGDVATGVIPKSDWAYSPDVKAPATDIAAAKEAYAKSGHKGELTLTVIQREPDVPMAQLVQAMLRSAGIPVKVEVLERVAAINKMMKRDYDFGIVRASMPRPDPDMSIGTWFGNNAANNYSGINDDSIVGLIAKARGLQDRKERAKLYNQAQQEVMDKFYHAYIAWAPARDGASSRLKGFKRDFADTWLYDEMSLAD